VYRRVKNASLSFHVNETFTLGERIACAAAPLVTAGEEASNTGLSSFIGQFMRRSSADRQAQSGVTPPNKTVRSQN
jgi:hypothetical protein